jgi:hypothetical protein
MTNSGRTPARKVKVHLRVRVTNETLDGPSKDEIATLDSPP